ncbi:MAG: elongation factor Ts, partial [Alphaproteobacteria bacterium CG_4_10_14_0_8_um_filter_53_9]
MDAKKALEEVGGDIEQAIDWLRQKGMAKAAKKSGRAASEGIVAIKTANGCGVMIEVNSETDFAAKNDTFSSFVSKVADLALAAKTGDVEEIKSLEFEAGKTVGDKLTDLIATVGENMTLRRAAMLSVAPGLVSGYVHMGGKIGVLVAIEGDGNMEDVAKQVAMHVAATNPQALDRDSVDQDLLARERAVYEAQAAETGKPAPVIEKIVEGRVSKFLEEICLVDQALVMDPDQKVGEAVAKAGGKVVAFARFGLGEGVEKVQEDFAAEVQKAMAG